MEPELLKKLVLTFTSELEEQSQQMTDGLLSLEKNISAVEKENIIKLIFRSAHNIKGASRGIGVNNLAEIAHCVESIFSLLQEKQITISRDIIDICLEAVDKMHSVFQAYVEKTPLTFDLAEFLQRLESGNYHDKTPTKELKNNIPQLQSQKISRVESNSKKTIRVPIEKIDKVSSLMEEIQVNKIAIDDYYTEINRLTEKTDRFTPIWKKLFLSLQSVIKNDAGENMQNLIFSSNDYFSEIHETVHHLNKNIRTQINELSIVSNSLQEEVQMLRLVPASYLFAAFPRYVRDLAHELNKQVELEINGSDVSMDNLILEGLKDPLIHIIRNAIDHGIENTDIRKKLGKPLIGHIKIEIKNENNQIIIDIEDDGGGIDIQTISEIALHKNLVSKQELSAMNNYEILDFIFRPGFSTKKIITDVSGRGVGLDVVKENINLLKGDVVLKTELGKGTTLSLHLPLTLSAERGLLVKVNDNLFVIPTHSVEHVWVISASEIINVEGTQAVLLNKHPIPLRILAVVLGIEKNDAVSTDLLSLVVIKQGRNMVAFLVDEIIGEREIVVKRLNKPITYLPCISGGTLLERNQVVIVLNPVDLITRALHVKLEHRLNMETTANLVVEKAHILVVDDSITTRTLEKNILENKNYKVTVAVNGKEAWDILQKESFSLIITDVNMPIMDGFSLTQNIKQDEKLRKIPVIIVTSLGSEKEKARGVEVGADAYIVKNEFESGALLQIVSQLV